MLRRHLGQRTVLGIAIPVLSAHIDAAKNGAPSAGLTEKQIETGFRELSSRFVRSDYHSTYTQRGLARFLEISGNHYRLHSELLAGVSIADFEQLLHELLESLRTAYETRQAVIQELMRTCSLPVERINERHALVDSYLAQLTGNRGRFLRWYLLLFSESISGFLASHFKGFQLRTDSEEGFEWDDDNLAECISCDWEGTAGEA